MRLFWELSKLSFQRQITYRAATLAGLATNLFFGLLRVAVLLALYAGRSQMEGMSQQDAITYTGISQASIAFLSLFSWYEVMHSVNSGAVAADLLKPMNFYLFWMGQDFGRALATLLLRGLPIMIAYALVFEISVPQTYGQWFAVLIALALSWSVSFSWRFLVNLAAFWTPNALGIARMAFILAWFLSGFWLPLRFFPDWMVSLCYLTPFPHTINTLVEVYLGLLSGPALVSAILGQLAWFVALIAAGQLVLRAGFHRLVIQGG
jgi:ABC-2 type transport system permease protein